MEGYIKQLRITCNETDGVDSTDVDLELHVIIEMDGAYRTGADLRLHVIMEMDGGIYRTGADLRKHVSHTEKTVLRAITSDF